MLYVAHDAFPDTPLLFFQEYQQRLARETLPARCVVPLGQSSGSEVAVGSPRAKISMDWILALIENRQLSAFVGLEVQSIDTTNNYRVNWQAYHDLPATQLDTVPPSEHGLNWANVHKRLIPQIIRKGKALHQSKLCQGLYFVAPDTVYRRFEDLIGVTTHVTNSGPGVLTVMTYALGPAVPYGQTRSLYSARIERVSLQEFADNFIAGGEMLSGIEIEDRVRSKLRF